MSEMEAQEKLEQQILDDARRQAEEIVSGARSKSAKTLADGTDAAMAEAERTISSGKTRAESRAAMLLRTAEQEIARRKLIERDELVRASVEQARVALSRIAGSAYRKIVVNLAASAIRGMRADSFVIKVGAPEDGSFKPSDVASDVAALLASEGKKVSLKAEAVEDVKGVIVQSEDGSLLWDNTFEGRLRRMQAELRRRVSPILFEES